MKHHSYRRHFQTKQLSVCQCNESKWPTSRICVGTFFTLNRPDSLYYIFINVTYIFPRLLPLTSQLRIVAFSTYMLTKAISAFLIKQQANITIYFNFKMLVAAAGTHYLPKNCSVLSIFGLVSMFHWLSWTWWIIPSSHSTEHKTGPSLPVC